jgi:hypothetical protein
LSFWHPSSAQKAVNQHEKNSYFNHFNHRLGKGRVSMSETWCILRTAGRSTMTLAATLAEDGFDVWTPLETIMVDVPRANVKRKVVRPIMKSYIFARAGHLVELINLSKMRVRPRRGPGLIQPAHVSFSVLVAFGRIPLVAERDLADLRKLEARRTPRKIAPYAFPRNKIVRVNDGIAQGKVGVVVSSTAAKTKILCKGDRHTIEIPTSLLELSTIQTDQQPILGIAA